MNWEESKALSPLKRDFLKAFFETEKRFFLTGGTALSAFYLEHRLSYDMDLFATQDFDWHEISNEVKGCAKQVDAQCINITSAPYFHRFELRRSKELEIVDFVREMPPQIDVEKPMHGHIRVDTMREIGVNKICTLLGRCETKDIIDLYFLEKEGFRTEDHLMEAKLKDGGIEPATISYLLSEFKINEIPHYMIKQIKIEELIEFIDSLKQRMVNLSIPGCL